MRTKTVKSFVSLIIVVIMLCGGIAVAAAPAYTSKTTDYANGAIVTRDGAPYSIKEKTLNIAESDYVGDHTFLIDTELPVDANYYISGKIKFTGANAVNAAPIIGLRSGVAIAFNGTQIKVGSGGSAFNADAVFDFNFEIGKEYNIVIESTMTRVSMWINGNNIINNYSLPYTSCGKAPNLTFKFPKSTGYFKNVHIWSNDEVEKQETTDVGTDITPVDAGKSDTLSEDKVLEVNTQAVQNNLWIAVISVIVAAVVIVLVIVYIVLKQRRA